MSSSTSDSSRKRSRWGDSSRNSNTGRPSSVSSSYYPATTARPTSTTATNTNTNEKSTAGASRATTASRVSDRDALQALLQSVEQQKRQKEEDDKQRDKKQRSRNTKQPPPHNSNTSHNNSSYSASRSRNQSDDAGYYGPPSRQRQQQQQPQEPPLQQLSSKKLPVVDVNDDEVDDRQKTSHHGRTLKRRRSVDGQGSDDDDHGRSGAKDATAQNDHNADETDGNNNNPPKIKPDFGLSGALSKDTRGGNVYKGVVLKFREPPEARAPQSLWRLYVYKGDDVVETLHISKQSAYLLGRNADIADIALLHPSCSSQHAVIQYRAVPSKDHGGELHCQPYLMDLESTNGSFVNDIQLDAARYYQLKHGDVLRFGASTREYVLINASLATKQQKK